MLFQNPPCKPTIRFLNGYWYVTLCGNAQLDRLALYWVVKANTRR